MGGGGQVMGPGIGGSPTNPMGGSPGVSQSTMNQFGNANQMFQSQGQQPNANAPTVPQSPQAMAWNGAGGAGMNQSGNAPGSMGNPTGNFGLFGQGSGGMMNQFGNAPSGFGQPWGGGGGLMSAIAGMFGQGGGRFGGMF